MIVSGHTLEIRRRNARILRMRAAGHTYKQIGAAFGLSSVRIRTIVIVTNDVRRADGQRLWTDNVDALGLEKRALKAIKRAGIRTITGLLMEESPRHWLKTNGFTVRTLAAIEDALRQRLELSADLRDRADAMIAERTR